MLGFLGGTGSEGRGLALRFALAGHEVLIGSRDPARAQEAARSVLASAPGRSVTGTDNSSVAQQADVVFIVVPFAAQKPVLETLEPALRRKVVVDAAIPLEFVEGRIRAVPVPEGSAALQAQVLLPHSQVVAAFHSLSATDLLRSERTINGDVLVFSDHAEAKRQVMELARLIPGVRAVDGGSLENARYAEDFTALLISINRIYKGRSMFRITGLPSLDAEQPPMP